MPAFDGTHTHALTNTVFHYHVELVDHGGVAQWRAEIRLDGEVVEHASGSTPYDAHVNDATRAVMNHLHRMIDAKDYGQRPNVFTDRPAPVR
jgi:hypothetical protein